MIRIILTSKTTNKTLCYHPVTDMREADRLAATYSRMDGIKVDWGGVAEMCRDKLVTLTHLSGMNNTTDV